MSDNSANSAHRQHEEVEKYLKAEKIEYDKIIKILLLGSECSGRSTIINQMRLIYSTGFSKEDRLQARPTIFASLIAYFEELLDIMAGENISLDTKDAKSAASMIAEKDPHGFSYECSLDTALHNSMKTLCREPKVQAAMTSGVSLPIRDNMLHFCKSFDRLTDPEYLPSDQDMLQVKCRRSFEFRESIFNIGSKTCMVVDLGASRTERRKWIHHFEDVHYLLFVGALSDYNEYLIENPNVSFICETMVLFDSVINNQWFRDTPVILFLNKMDIFREKLAVSPLSEHFPDFNGSNTDLLAAAGHVDQLFRKLNKSHGRQIHTHYTDATDKESIKATFESVQNQMPKGIGIP